MFRERFIDRVLGEDHLGKPDGVEGEGFVQKFSDGGGELGLFHWSLSFFEELLQLLEVCGEAFADFEVLFQ
jgi:hypothetical protein